MSTLRSSAVDRSSNVVPQEPQTTVVAWSSGWDVFCMPNPSS
jgi:hypothetical protein